MAVAPGVSAATGQPVRILMLGDSLTSGHGLIKGGSLPDRLQEALQKAAPGSQVLNAGVSGDTTAGGRSRLAWSLVAQSDALIVALGANDGLRGLAPEQTYANLNAILSAAKKAGLPVFGICLGHQILALALGCKTHKMHMGHRGANQPVKDLETGRVEITSQNHGFVVDRDSLPKGVVETHVSLFDGSLEGIRVDGKPVFSVQYHPEASPGPQDSHYLFERFVGMMGK